MLFAFQNVSSWVNFPTAWSLTSKAVRQRGSRATTIFWSTNLPLSIITWLSKVTVQSRIGTS